MEKVSKAWLTDAKKVLSDKTRLSRKRTAVDSPASVPESHSNSDTVARWMQKNVEYADPENGVDYDTQKHEFTVKDSSRDDIKPRLERARAITNFKTSSTAIRARENFENDIVQNIAPEIARAVKLSSNNEEDMWNDVFRTIHSALVKYQNVGPIHRALRKIGDGVPALQQYMQLFPESILSKTLIGGITILFDAAEKLVEVRQTVFEILADIPYRVRSIKKLQLLYELDPSQKGFTAELHEISGEVYDGILNVIGVTIKWLATKSERKFFLAATLGSQTYTKSISEALSALEALSIKLWREAEFCLHNTLLSLRTEHHDFRSENRTYWSDQQKRMATLEKHLNFLQTLLIDNMVRTYRIQPFEPPRTSTVNLKRRFEELLAPDSMNSGLGTEAQDYALHAALAADALEKDRVNWVVAQREFRNWFAAPRSRILVISGNGEDERISPMSYLCAMVAKTLVAARTPCVAFFCGSSGDQGILDGFSGVYFLRSLVLQTFRIPGFRFDLGFLEELEGGIPRTEEMYNPRLLERCLRGLLEQLKEGTVLFWIVDGVSWYESQVDNMARRMDAVMGVLENIVKTCWNVVIKLLVAYPGQQTWISHRFGRGHDTEWLEVPEYVDGNEWDVYEFDTPFPGLVRRRSSGF